jgi:competence protein ComEA
MRVNLNWHAMLKKIILTAALCVARLACAEVDANLASVAELDSIRGIGPSMSRQILAQRDNGKFKDWSDLMARVPGVKAKTAAKFSAQGMTVDGKAFTP